jgi:hypothetical protein
MATRGICEAGVRVDWGHKLIREGGGHRRPFFLPARIARKFGAEGGI